MHLSTPLLLLRNIMAAMGGLFWGYFQSHFNTTSDIYNIMMHIEPDNRATFTGLTTGMIQFGGICGAVLSCFLVNKLSRRHAFFLIDCLALFGVGIHCFKSIPLLFIGNFLGGMSMGLNSTFIGTYISEVSPTLVSGLMGSLVQYTISVGMIIVSILGLFMPTTTDYIFDQNRQNDFWLVIFLVPALFPLIRLLAFSLFYKLDTPYYYAEKNDLANLTLSLEEIYRPEHVQQMSDTLTSYVESKVNETQSLSEIIHVPLIRRKTMIGVGLAFVM